MSKAEDIKALQKIRSNSCSVAQNLCSMTTLESPPVALAVDSGYEQEPLFPPEGLTDEALQEILFDLPNLDSFAAEDLRNGFDLLSHPSTPENKSESVSNSGDDSGCRNNSRPASTKQPSAGQSRYQRSQDRQRTVAAKLQELNAAVASQSAARANLLTQAASLEAVSQAQQESGSAARLQYLCSSRILSFFGADGKRRELPAAELADMLPDEVFKAGTVYATKLRPLLLAANGDSQCAAGQAAVRLVEEWENVMSALRRFNTSPVVERVCARSSQSSYTPPPGLWSSLLAEMRLSSEQKTAALQARQTYLQTIGETLRERHQILARIQDLQGDAGALTVPDIIQSASQRAQLVKQMQQNLLADRTAFMDLCVKVMIQIVTQFQKAAIIVYTWPDASDLLLLLNELALEEHEPSVQQLIKISELPEVVYH
ncbi:hypothetical protein WJX84_000203 [Apatococcus fuscideae]|uniref:Uncharacterized protein n=1 Tax=Apatococcus fuscideae TaxID=2026836 RepID=A0AAW1TB25_9CHLO